MTTLKKEETKHEIQYRLVDFQPQPKDEQTSGRWTISICEIPYDINDSQETIYVNYRPDFACDKYSPSSTTGTRFRATMVRWKLTDQDKQPKVAGHCEETRTMWKSDHTVKWFLRHHWAFDARLRIFEKMCEANLTTPAQLFNHAFNKTCDISIVGSIHTWDQLMKRQDDGDDPYLEWKRVNKDALLRAFSTWVMEFDTVSVWMHFALFIHKGLKALDLFHLFGSEFEITPERMAILISTKLPESKIESWPSEIIYKANVLIHEKPLIVSRLCVDLLPPLANLVSLYTFYY